MHTPLFAPYASSACGQGRRRHRGAAAIAACAWQGRGGRVRLAYPPPPPPPSPRSTQSSLGWACQRAKTARIAGGSEVTAPPNTQAVLCRAAGRWCVGLWVPPVQPSSRTPSHGASYCKHCLHACTNAQSHARAGAASLVHATSAEWLAAQGSHSPPTPTHQARVSCASQGAAVAARPTPLGRTAVIVAVGGSLLQAATTAGRLLAAAAAAAESGCGAARMLHLPSPARRRQRHRRRTAGNPPQELLSIVRFADGHFCTARRGRERREQGEHGEQRSLHTPTSGDGMQ